VEMMRCAQGGRGIALADTLDHAIPNCMMDKDCIKEVILNLMSNAVQASPQGKTVAVRTFRHRRQAVFEVSDHGHGILDADRKRIFSPFFSKKKGGTGLGLTIAKKIVLAHGGTITFYQNPGRGVTFRVALPLKSKWHWPTGILNRQLVGSLRRC
jgi:signal transduction histidine kinase